MAKSKVIKALFKAAVRYGGGGWGKTNGRLGVKIASKLCTSSTRDELFLNATLRVIISADPLTDTNPPLPGMSDEYPTVEITVKVNQYSTSDSEVSFGMTFDSNDMDAAFLKMISHAAGSLYVLSVTANADGNAAPEEEEDGEDNEE